VRCDKPDEWNKIVAAGDAMASERPVARARQIDKAIFYCVSARSSRRPKVVPP
jgi:hypothetical protein